METLGMVNQREFLINLGLEHLQIQLLDRGLSPQQVQANLAGISNLVRPDGLGNFKVLAQAKNIDSPPLWGLGHTEEVAALVAGLPTPVLTERHLSLPDGRNLGGEAGFEDFWPT